MEWMGQERPKGRKGSEKRGHRCGQRARKGQCGMRAKGRKWGQRARREVATGCQGRGIWHKGREQEVRRSKAWGSRGCVTIVIVGGRKDSHVSNAYHVTVSGLG